MDEVPAYEAPQAVVKPWQPWIIVTLVLVVATALTVFGYFRFSKHEEGQNGLEDSDLLYEGSREALERNIAGTDRQHLYSQRGTFVRIENSILYYRVENTTIADGETYVDLTERAGTLSADVTVTSFSPDPNNPASVVSRTISVNDIRPSALIEVRTYQNILATDDFTIEEISVVY